MKQFIFEILANKATLILICLVALTLMSGGFESLHPHPHI